MKVSSAAAALAASALVLWAAPALAGRDADPDGAYVGKFDSTGSKYGVIEFDVKGNGKRLQSFGAVVVAVCVNPNAPGGIEVIPVAVGLDRAKIAKNGKFDETVEMEDSNFRLSLTVAGKLRNERVKRGTLELEGTCTAERIFMAKRKR